jgi:hypothetical protein
MRTRFRPGSSAATDGPVVVSYTEFTVHHLRDVPGIAWAGLALRRGWWAMPGAIGVALYFDVRARRGGSVSAWTNAEDLRRFVALPRHVAIMRRYRTRGTVRAATWTTTGFRVGPALAEGRARAQR